MTIKQKIKKILDYVFFKSNQVIDVVTNFVALAIKIVNLFPTGYKVTKYLEAIAEAAEKTGKYVDDFESLKEEIVEQIPEQKL